MNNWRKLGAAGAVLLALLFAAPERTGAQGVYDELSADQRSLIQFLLIWTGDYNGMMDGQIGRRTFAAITPCAECRDLLRLPAAAWS